MIFLQKNLNFLIKERELKNFCQTNNIKYRTLQDIKLGNTINPRIDIIIKLSTIFNISIDTLLLKDLTKENN